MHSIYKFFLPIYLFLTLLPAFAQKTTSKYTVSGFVKETASGGMLIGANVYLKETLNGTVTNAYGFYSLTAPAGKYTLVISYLGFKSVELPVDLSKDVRMNSNMESNVVQTKEVVISAEKGDRNIKAADMGSVRLGVDEIKKLPAFLGEVDVMKTIQLLPGVKSAGEGNSGFYVRGGGPDQNLILLDEAVVYNPSHLLGFFSVFNGDAVKDVNLIKGGMPAQYGGRLASVLDVSMKDGNNKNFQVDGGIGLIASRLTVQGPIQKDKSSFIFSARRTYVDILLKPFISSTSRAAGSSIYFYDLNGKVNYILSDKNRIFLSGYYGKDVFAFGNASNSFRAEIPYGNATANLRWNHLFNDKLFMNASAIFSNYSFEFNAAQGNFELKLLSGIRDYNAKLDFNYFPNIRHSIKFGGNYVFHTFIPNDASAKQGNVSFLTGVQTSLYAHDAAVYLSDDWDVSDKIRINAGVRASYFMQVGPFDRYIKNSLDEITDTIHFGNNAKVSNYAGIEPRLAIRYSLTQKTSLKASFSMNNQYVHLASLSSVSLPTDIWIPSTSMVKPQLGTQYAAGIFRNFHENMFEASVEMYYKTMKNQVEYKDGSVPADGIQDNLDYSLTFGKGESYGVELFVKKRTGKFTGWMGYTLSYTTRQFADLNYGKIFFAKYDRRHDASVVLSYELNDKWSFSSVFVYGTGNAVTLPVEWYLMEGKIVYNYSDRNVFRMAPYHRLDISATLQGKKNKRFQNSWNFSIFNVYNRQNPFFLYFDRTGDIFRANLKITAQQVSLFPIIPSVTWNFKF